MKKIAITGGIGSGKSEVLKILKDEGYKTFSCDEIYKEISLEEEYVQKIFLYFPETIEQGIINKKILANIVFFDEEKRKLLNSIAHPLIMKRLEEKMENGASSVAFAEVPLLFEGGYHTLFDEVIVIRRDIDDRISAVVARDGINREDVLNRMNSQFNYHVKEGEEFIKKIGAKTLKNDGDLKDLKHQLKILLNDLM